MMPVQGRYDMSELVRLELTKHSYKEYIVPEGVARDYGNGLWAIYLNEPIFIDSLFTGFYGSWPYSIWNLTSCLEYLLYKLSLGCEQALSGRN